MSKKLTDKQRIKQLENELEVYKIQIQRIKDIVGITDDYVHQPVQPLKLK